MRREQLENYGREVKDRKSSTKVKRHGLSFIKIPENHQIHSIGL